MEGIERRAFFLVVMFSAVVVAALESLLLGAVVAGFLIWVEVNGCSFWR